MSSRDSNSLAASSRSQSQIWRCTSGSDFRRRSGRREKGPPWSSRAGSLLSLLPLLPDQKTVRQHHTHRVPVKARPQPALILVPAQQPLGLFVILLHPVPPVARTPPSAPTPPPDRSCSSSTAACRPRHPHRSASPPDAAPPTSPASRGRRRSAAHPALASLPPSHRTPRPRRLGRDQDIGPSRLPAAARDVTAKSARTATTYRFRRRSKPSRKLGLSP